MKPNPDSNDVAWVLNSMEEYRERQREWPNVAVPYDVFAAWVRILFRDLPVNDPKGTEPWVP